MNWSELVNEGFPSPHEREPAELRGDIADELSDHLTCIFEGEQNRNESDEHMSRDRALERFGNPKRIAYRLWWEAMKERIMRDRIILIAMILMALATIAVSGFAWTSLQRAQEINRTTFAALGRLENRNPAERSRKAHHEIRRKRRPERSRVRSRDGA